MVSKGVGVEVMFRYKINVDVKEWDLFLENHPQGNLLQSSDWSKIKDTWGNERVGFYKDNQLVGVANILIQPLPLGFSMFYIPRGPVIDYEDKELLKFVLLTLKKLAKKSHAIMVKFDPSLFISRGLIDQETVQNSRTLEIVEELKKNKVYWTGLTKDMAENIQPRFQANIHKENFSLDQLSKSTRQAIRTARNKGLEVKFGGLNLLDEFSFLMKKTESRKNISLRGKDYYQKLLDTYPDHSFITLSYLDLPNRLKEVEQQLEKNLKTAQKFTDKTKEGKIKENQQERKRLEEEISFLKSHIGRGDSVVPLSGTLTIEFGKTSENLYAGMNEEFRHYQPAIPTWFETAQHSFERGAETHNMGGIENNLEGGLINFKSKFNPTIEEFAGEFNYPTSSLYFLFNLAYKIRKKLRSR